MEQRTTRVNPSEETIKIGPLGIRFLLTGDDSTVMGPEYFREAAELINTAAGGPPDRVKMMDVFRRHGMTMAVPPPTK